jgi:purine-binding chemotaxis protein CheW
MTRRRTLVDNPLDVLIPQAEPPTRREEPDPAPAPATSASSAPSEEEPKPQGPPQADPTSVPETVAARQYLTFFLAGEEYAISILRAREIITYESITTVPKTPPWIRGVMNLRGSVVPVVDLGLKFGLPESAITDRSCIIVAEAQLEEEQTVMGIMVDSVSQVVTLAQEDIEPPPAFGTRVDVSFLSGMGKLEGGFVLILDVDRALSADELLRVSVPPGSTEGVAVSPAS